MTREAKSFCRVCYAFCGTIVTVENDHVIKVHGDRGDPLSRGYICFKGVQAPEQHNGPARLLHPLRRVDDRLEPTTSTQALDEAGRRLADIVERYGPGAVGFFTGTQCFLGTLNSDLVNAFARALDTPRVFATMTIDQSAKWIAEQRLGAWVAGPQTFMTSDVWMIIGANPLVSMTLPAGADGLAFTDPVKTVKEVRARGMKLIVIDPRRSETAKVADLFLQPLPGRDAELIAAILHVIFREGWHDAQFCRDYVDGLEDLRAALQPFAPQICAQTIGVTPAEIEAAAALFARDARSGMAGGGTGPDMARHSNLAEHLIQVLNVVCGRFPREGEAMANPGVLLRGRSARAGVSRPAQREWEQGPKTRKHGLGRLKGTMMSAEITAEILHPGEDRMRALICIGGNPAVALPDQAKAEEALQALDLLIVIDPRMSATARLADYVFAPPLQYERPDHTGFLERLHQVPYGHVTPAIVPEPDGSDLVADWRVLWSLARSCGLTLNLRGHDLPTDQPPTTEELFVIQTEGTRVSLAEVAAHDGGAIFPGEPTYIQPRRDNNRFQLMPADVAGEIADLLQELRNPQPFRAADASEDTFQLTVRRHRETMNSAGSDFDATWARMPGNPAYLHEDDMARLGLKAGDLIEIVRSDARIAARVAVDNGVRRGVISVGHARPGLRSRPWEATNALVDGENEVQAINRMPVMTGINVKIERVSQEAQPQWLEQPAPST